MVDGVERKVCSRCKRPLLLSLSNEEEVGYACSGATYKENEKHTVPKAVAQFAIACADVLINELKGK